MSETLGRYRILKELGQGAMGRVFLAHDPHIDRHVALKTIQVFAALPEDEREEARERFKREARAAGRLLHPGIVTVFDVGEHDDVPYIAMEYVEGASLDQFTSSARLLPADEVVEMIAGLAEALAYAHDRDVVHRDIKPANLMRVGPSTAKIMDFGLAKNPATQLTSDGKLLGTPSYMSPEQIRGERLDGRSDLFALGCVAYELLTGQKAFGGDSISSVVYRIVHEEPGSATERRAGLPDALDAFMERALAKDPDERFENGRAFAEALRSAARGTAPIRDDASETAVADPGSAEPETGTPPAPPGGAPGVAASERKRASGTLLVVGFLIVAAVIAGAAWYYLEEMRGRHAAGDVPVVPSSPLDGGGSADEGAARRDPEGGRSEATPRQTPPPGRSGSVQRVTVRTEPEGLPITLDGAPVDAGTLEVPSRPPYGTLRAVDRCREVERPIEPADFGGEIVLVPDPVRASVTIDAETSAAAVSVNGSEIGTAPVTAELDLCAENVVVLRAEGYRPERVTLSPGLSPMEARARVSAVALEPIPMGTLRIEAPPYDVTVYVDGEGIGGDIDALEVEAGRHRVRFVNGEVMLDVTENVQIEAGSTARVGSSLPALAEVAVRSNPVNCEVAVRRGGGAFTTAGRTPIRALRLVPGAYELRITNPVTGDVRTREVRLASGRNAAIAVSFVAGN